MPEKENDDVQRIERGSVRPAVAMAAHMASHLYAARVGAITAAQFVELFNSTAANEPWRDHSINLRTAALMVATALQLQATLGQAVAFTSMHSPTDPAAAQAGEHAQRTMEAVAALSALADQFGGGAHA